MAKKKFLRILVCEKCSALTAPQKGSIDQCESCGSKDVGPRYPKPGPRPGFHFVPCPGEAHSNAHIDNCMLCAPRWGLVEIPTAYENLAAYRTREEA